MQNTKHTFAISIPNNNQRIDSVAAEIFGADASRSHLQKYGTFWLKNDTTWIKKSYKSKTKTNQTWKVEYQPPVDNFAHLKPWETDLDILAETNHWIAINKPIGVSVHPSSSENSDQTIVNALLHYFGTDFSKKFQITLPLDQGELPEAEGIESKNESRHSSGASLPSPTTNHFRPGIVHRLDKTTSGVLLIAKDHQTLRLLQKNWPKTQKFYAAIVHGNPPANGKISGGIMRDPKNRLRMTVSDHPKAKPATTLFESKGVWPYACTKNQNLSILNVQILTGRTHQIRSHLSSIGFPILGDKLYGGKTAERIFLHAQTLAFTDPHSEETIKITTPLPQNFYPKTPD